MPTFTIKIENLDEIRRAFRKAPRLMIKYANEAIRLSIFAIGRQATINSPVRTGRMRASILGSGVTFGNLVGEVGPTVFYAIFVHEGTRFMKGRPFLLNALKSKEDEVMKYFEDSVEKVLKDIGD